MRYYFMIITLLILLQVWKSFSSSKVNLLVNHLSKNSPTTKYGRKVSILYSLLFFFIVISNFLGLYTHINHPLISSTRRQLIIVVLFLWVNSYNTFILRGWKYLTSGLIVNITYPSLSLLLSNIEILTHLFRPITLIARMWVNIWVGHALLSIVSFFLVKFYFSGPTLYRSFISYPLLQGGLILYELIITLLQSLVIIYLSFIYYRDNLESTKP